MRFDKCKRLYQENQLGITQLQKMHSNQASQVTFLIKKIKLQR